MSSSALAQSVGRFIRHLQQDPRCVDEVLTPEVVEVLTIHRDARARAANGTAQDIYRRRATQVGKGQLDG